MWWLRILSSTFRNYKHRSCPRQKLKTCSVLLTIVKTNCLFNKLQKRSAQQLGCLVRTLKGITPCQKWNHILHILLNWWNLLWHQETVWFQMVWTRKYIKQLCDLHSTMPNYKQWYTNPNHDFVFGGAKLQAEQDKKLIELPKKQPCVFLRLYTPPKINRERHLIQKHIFHPPPFLRFPCQFFQGVSWLAKKSLLGSHGGSRSA